MPEGQANASLTLGRVTLGGAPFTGQTWLPGSTAEPRWTPEAITPPPSPEARARRERIAIAVLSGLAGLVHSFDGQEARLAADTAVSWADALIERLDR